MTAVPIPPTPPTTESAAARKARPAHPPLLDQLAQWYPRLFGRHLLPLKRGIFEDLVAAHALDPAELKQALAWHARSTRYLAAVASGQPRHDLQGKAVEPVAPEHVHHAIMEVFKRRQRRSGDDLRSALRRQLIAAFERSALSPSDYLARVHGRDATANQLVQEALDEAAAQAARRQALQHAFAASGKPVEEFAQMYGMSLREVRQALSI